MAATLLLTLLSTAGGLAPFEIRAAAQSAPPPASPPPQRFKGCVQPSPTDKDTLILTADSTCAKLTGKFSVGKLSGHQIDLKGVLAPRTSTDPATIHVDSVVSVGKTCSDVCSLQPPRSRGLTRGGETPGKEGGTPGLAPTPAPPPQ
jgi:hypothetical protein